MDTSLIRVRYSDLRTLHDSRYFGACPEPGEVCIWKSDAPQSLARVRSPSRYVLDPSKRRIFSAEWEGDLTCRDYANGKVIWRRRDLPGIQKLALSSAFPDSVFVLSGTTDKPYKYPRVKLGAIEIQAASGKSRWMMERADNLYVHPTKPLILLVDRGDFRISLHDRNKVEVASIPMTNFAVLDAAFTEDLIALAEGAEGVRVIDWEGNAVSHYAPSDRQPNCLAIAFDQGKVCVYDSWDKTFVSIFDPHSGLRIKEYERKCHGRICFIDDGSRFVDQLGQISITSTGELDGVIEAGAPTETRQGWMQRLAGRMNLSRL